jgi:hypothetical protein
MRVTTSQDHSTPTSRVWTVGFVVILLGLLAGLVVHVNKPFIGYHEWGTTIWAQTAHNNLRAGLLTTLGVPSGTYCGPLPIPQTGYFIDHPPMLPLTVTALFAVFGEQEWAARLVPIVCSLGTIVCLWLLVRSCVGERAATLCAAVFALQPMELYFGRVVDHEACGLFFITAVVLCIRCWHLTNEMRWRNAALTCLFVGMWTAWPVYLLAGVGFWVLLAMRQRAEKRLAWIVFTLTAASVVLYVLYIRLGRSDAWDILYAMFQFRTGVKSTGDPGIPWLPWALRQIEYLTTRFSPTAWGLALIGAVYLIKHHAASQGLRWLMWANLTLLLVAVLWIVGFRNGSYIHSFWGFYFLPFVAIAAGLGLDWLLSFQEKAIGTPLLQRLALTLVVLAFVLQATWAVAGTARLHREQHTISGRSEPYELHPILGKAIAAQFPDDTFIIANLPSQNMPLEYYAHRNLIYFQTIEGWNEVLRHQGKRCRGLIWMEAPGASELLAALPSGTRTIQRVGDLSFCFWSP